MDPTNNPTSTTPNPEPTDDQMPNSDAQTPEAAGSDGATTNENATASSGAPNPVGQPGAAAGVVNPVVQPSGQTPVNPVVKPSGLGVTDPIMMPEKPQEPDPVEEELKAPMKAAAPAPGSIGSAVSGPADGNDEQSAETAGSAENPFVKEDVKPTPNVSFNDPAAQPDNNGAPTNPGQGDKKKVNKTTLIVLIAVAAVIVVVLAIVLIMSLSGGGGGGNNQSGSGSGGSNSVSQNDDVDDNDDTDDTDEPLPEPDDTDYSAAVVCTTEFQDDEGYTNSQTLEFGINDGQLVGVNIGVDLSDSTGELVSGSSQFVSFDNMTDNAAVDVNVDTTYVDQTGKLLISETELSDKLQTALNSTGTNVYACEYSEDI